MQLTDTGMRLVTHGRFPMTEVGLGRITDWEFDGKEPRAHMLVNGPAAPGRAAHDRHER